jgi:regulator of nucleoside diphosphate kinase
MMNRPLTHPIVLTNFDRNRLRNLLALFRERSSVVGSCLDALDHELARARIVPASEVPPDVVTMNSRVSLCDLESGERSTVSLVFPRARDTGDDAVPVLSPLGLALLGCRAGHVLSWDTPDGLRTLLIERVAYQPEAAGLYHF